MAKKNVVVVEIGGVSYEQIPITRGKKADKKAIGTGHLPVPPAVVPNDHDADEEVCLNWIQDMVEGGVFTYRQIVGVPGHAAKGGLYNIYLKQSARVGREFIDAAEGNTGKKITIADMTAIFAFRDRAIAALGNKADDQALLTATMEKMWRDSMRTAAGEWDASKHVLFPKDVR